jgi:hypothetical protein
MNMKFIGSFFSISFLFFFQNILSQNISLNSTNCQSNLVNMSIVKFEKSEVLRVVKDSSIQKFDEPTFVKLKDLNFKNGSIEVKVLSRMLKNAPEFARGFIGIAFRINESNTAYESIYIRPTNGRSDDQTRRNHSIQYYSYPDYKFDTLRKISPEKYESYSDMELNKWIVMRIDVQGDKAKLYLNNAKQPSLIVNDLKLGSNNEGGIGLWVEIGTEGYFKDLKITKQ